VSARSDGGPIRTEKPPVITKANSSMVGKSEVDFWFARHPLADAYLFDSSKGDA
jgi:hypothetical protein